MTISKTSAQHYIWGDACEGWILSPSVDMTVIQERMPPHTAEKRHLHNRSRQFFFVLCGRLTMELNGEVHQLGEMSGIEVPPGAKHQARNDAAEDVHFLVISSPTARGDRTEI